MICLDTNLLVHAHQRESSLHTVAKAYLKKIAEDRAPWRICYHSLIEFYGVVTKKSLWEISTTPSQAFRQIQAWKSSPSLTVLYDNSTSLELLEGLLVAGKVTGPMVHDARIAACCLSNGVRLLHTVDRDFSRFPKLKTVNPLL